MAQRRPGPYKIHTTEKDGTQMVFNTVASSDTEAERIFRRLHPHWKREIRVEPPAFPKTKGEK